VSLSAVNFHQWLVAVASVNDAEGGLVLWTLAASVAWLEILPLAADLRAQQRSPKRVFEGLKLGFWCLEVAFFNAYAVIFL
jgi:hypothetical protein